MNGCTICGDDEAQIICDRDKCQEIFWRERAKGCAVVEVVEGEDE